LFVNVREFVLSRIVMKFGGTSVADIERIRNVALHVKREADAGHEVAVVVSAMSGKTNELVAWTKEIAPMHDAREYDTVVASGEQVTSGLLAMALQNLGVDARSWMGWQIPLKTDSTHGAARIDSIDSDFLVERISGGQVAVIAGFQGISPENRIATLGRGGSDTSAVAIAAAINADRCDIYTDVDGVYTTDPRIEPRAKRMEKISFEEMLEMASLGAKVLQVRSVEMAMVHGVRTFVRSSFDDPNSIDSTKSSNAAVGTLICDEDEIVEKEVVTGIAYTKDEAQISLRRVPDSPGVSAAIFGPLADAHINVDMIVQNISDENRTDMTFTVHLDQFDRAVATIEAAKDQIGFKGLVADKDVAKVSVVGIGMRSHTGVAQKMFAALAEDGVNIQVITTSEIKVSVLIQRRYMELAVRSLHTAFGLEAA